MPRAIVVIALLLLLPAPGEALTLEYELARQSISCEPADSGSPRPRRRAAGDGPALGDVRLGSLGCLGDAPPSSNLLDSDGSPYTSLLGSITLEATGGGTQITRFTVGGPVGRTGLFAVNLLEPVDVEDGGFEAVVIFLDEKSTRRIEFDPAELLAGLHRLEFVATLVPTILIEGRCLSRNPASPGTSLPSAGFSQISCEEARKNPELEVIESPERELVNLHIVAVAVPEPATLALFGATLAAGVAWRYRG